MNTRCHPAALAVLLVLMGVVTETCAYIQGTPAYRRRLMSEHYRKLHTDGRRGIAYTKACHELEEAEKADCEKLRLEMREAEAAQKREAETRRAREEKEAVVKATETAPRDFKDDDIQRKAYLEFIRRLDAAGSQFDHLVSKTLKIMDGFKWIESDIYQAYSAVGPADDHREACYDHFRSVTYPDDLDQTIRKKIQEVSRIAYHTSDAVNISDEPYWEFCEDWAVVVENFRTILDNFDLRPSSREILHTSRAQFEESYRGLKRNLAKIAVEIGLTADDFEKAARGRSGPKKGKR